MLVRHPCLGQPVPAMIRPTTFSSWYMYIWPLQGVAKIKILIYHFLIFKRSISSLLFRYEMEFPFHSKLGTELWCIWLENKGEKTITAIILKPVLLVNRKREMLSFELGKEMEKDVLRLVTSVGQRKKIWVPTRNRTSDLRIPLSYALPVSHRDSTVGEVFYEVHMKRCILLGSTMSIASCL